MAFEHEMGWDDEGPTVAEHWTRLPGGQLAPDRTSSWTAISDTGIRAAFRDDLRTTSRDLPALNLGS